MVWLNSYEILLLFNFWNAWREFVTLDEATSKKNIFFGGKIKISMSAFEVINHSVNLDHNDLLFSIRVVEEQVVNNFMKVVCECIGFPRVKGMIREKEKVEDETVLGDN